MTSAELAKKAHEAVADLDKFVPPCEGCGCDRNIAKRAHSAIDALAESRGHAMNCYCHEHPRSQECYAFIEQAAELSFMHKHPYTDPRCSQAQVPECPHCGGPCKGGFALVEPESKVPESAAAKVREVLRHVLDSPVSANRQVILRLLRVALAEMEKR